jgi:hypothetical protein
MQHLINVSHLHLIGLIAATAFVSCASSGCLPSLPRLPNNNRNSKKSSNYFEKRDPSSVERRVSESFFFLVGDWVTG